MKRPTNSNSTEEKKQGVSPWSTFNIWQYLLIFTLIIVLIPAIFLALDFFNINSRIGFTVNYDWLGFFGGFLGGTFGGVATFLGVYLTLKHQRKADKESQRLALIPILEYKIRYDKSDFDNSRGQLADEGIIPLFNIGQASFEDKNSLEWYFNLIINNVGMGHAQISTIQLKFLNAQNPKEVITEENMGYTYKLVKKDDERSFKCMIYAPRDNAIGMVGYGLNITINYQDLLGNRYEQVVHAGIAGGGGINHANLSSYENFKLLN